jgi:hypothetical protein
VYQDSTLRRIYYTHPDHLNCSKAFPAAEKNKLISF